MHLALIVSIPLQHLGVRMKELLHVGRLLRRFKRLIAKQSTYVDVAKRVVFADVYSKILTENLNPRETKRLLKKALKNMKEGRESRLSIIGDGDFGNGKRGPCPRKAVISAIGRICPVLLVNEDYSSTKCHRCGNYMTQVGRRQQCRNTLVGGRVRRFDIDRDTNGALNIGQIGLLQLRGLPRPLHLPIANRNKRPSWKRNPRKRNAGPTTEGTSTRRRKRSRSN